MYRTFTKGFAIALLLSAASFGQSGQSLGISPARTARSSRRKRLLELRPESSPTRIFPLPRQRSRKPAHPSPSTTVSGVQRSFEGRASNQRFDEKSLAEQRAGEQWRSRIQEQQDRIAGIQARIDHLNASLHPAGSAQYEGPYDRYQAIQMERLAQMQEMLDQQTRRLSAMQEAARHAGMHTTVYDP